VAYIGGLGGELLAKLDGFALALRDIGGELLRDVEAARTLAAGNRGPGELVLLTGGAAGMIEFKTGDILAEAIMLINVSANNDTVAPITPRINVKRIPR